MRKLKYDIGNVTRGNLVMKGKPDMFGCKHYETYDKTNDNWRTCIYNTPEKGVKHYEKA